MNSKSEKDRFIKIIKENRRILYKVIYSYCSDDEDRKDLEQEIIIQLWKSLENYNADYKLSTWIYRVALNVAISHYRKDFKRAKSNTSLDAVIFKSVDYDEASEELDSRRQLLHKFIEQLDEFNKAIIILHLEDKNYKEISEVLGISESNVGTKLNRIKNRLREHFFLLNK